MPEQPSFGVGIDDFNVIVEIPALGGEIKYEFDKKLGMLLVDRFIATSMRYPCNYGFVPSTLSLDGDPVDVLVITPHPIQPGAMLRVRGVGVLNMMDESGEDQKILAVPISKTCKQYENCQDINDVPPQLLDSITHFFEHYKDLESSKWVKVKGWEDKVAAEKELNASINRFQEEIVKA